MTDQSPYVVVEDTSPNPAEPHFEVVYAEDLSGAFVVKNLECNPERTKIYVEMERVGEFLEAVGIDLSQTYLPRGVKVPEGIKKHLKKREEEA